MPSNAITARTRAFTERFGLALPILLAPMSGACPPALSAAVTRAGGMGSCGALTLAPAAIADWASAFRGLGGGAFQFNLWVPDPVPERDPAREDSVRRFLGAWGPAVPVEAGDAPLQDFSAQCRAVIEAVPTAASSVMGLFPPEMVGEMRRRGIAWFACATTLAEAVAAVEAGADAIVAQGMEAGGHRGCFEAASGEAGLVGLMSLVPAIVDAVRVPVIAAGGIADGRGIAASLMLGASAVAVGTGYLRTPEAGIAPAWAEALARTPPEGTMVTRAFSGRAGRGLANDYAKAAAGVPVAPYPVQRGLTAAMRGEATAAGDVERMQAWAGQSAALAGAEPAGTLTERLWRETQALMG